MSHLSAMRYPSPVRSLLLLAVIWLPCACSVLSNRPEGDQSASQSSVTPTPAPAAGSSTPLGSLGTSTGAPPPNGTVASANDAAAGTATASDNAAAAQAQASQCAQLRADIRGAMTTERQAPSTSTDTDIVAATEAKADKKIDDLQQQYDQLGCPSGDFPPEHSRTPVLPPAPGEVPGASQNSVPPP